MSYLPDFIPIVTSCQQCHTNLQQITRVHATVEVCVWVCVCMTFKRTDRLVNECENMTKDHPILAVKWKSVSIIAYRKSVKQISRCNLPIFLSRGIIESGVTHTSGNIRCTQPLHSERSDRQNNPHDMIRATYSLHRRIRMCFGVEGGEFEYLL